VNELYIGAAAIGLTENHQTWRLDSGGSSSG